MLCASAAERLPEAYGSQAALLDSGTCSRWAVYSLR